MGVDCAPNIHFILPSKNTQYARNELHHVGGRRLFVLAAQNQNKHTETILFKTLLGPLALASYWLTLTY